MSKSRIGNEAKTINLFLSLSDEGRRIVLDVLKSQSATPRKAASKKPSTSQAAAKESTADKDPVPPGLCVFKFADGSECLTRASNPIHDPKAGYGGYHEFVAAKVTRKPRTKKETPAVTPVSDQGIDGNGLAAEMSGD